jgi:hypothetical protein
MTTINMTTTTTMRTSSKFEGEYQWDENAQQWQQVAGDCDVPRVPRDEERAKRHLRRRFGSCKNLRPWSGGHGGGWVWEVTVEN